LSHHIFGNEQLSQAFTNIIEGVLPALLFVAGFDLCFLGGEYTYWVLSAAAFVIP